MQTYYLGRVHNWHTKIARGSGAIIARFARKFETLWQHINLAGDFRQTLPIIPRSTPADEMNACLKNSNLWAHVKTLKLTTNMRVRLQNDDSGQTFSDQLLAIGNGKLPVDSISGRIQLPAEFCNLVTSKNELVEKVFPNILTNYKNHKWLSERAILAAKNKDVHEINNIILTKIRDQAVIYKSVDTVLEPNEAVNYPSEFLNSWISQGFHHTCYN